MRYSSNDNIFERANKPETLMNILSEHHFRQVQGSFRCTQHSSYEIKRSKQGRWYFRSHNGDYGDTAHSPYNLLLYLNPNASKTELMTLLAKAADTTYTPPQEKEEWEQKKAKQKANDGKPKEIVFAKTLLSFNSRETFRVLQEKIGFVDFSELEEHEIKIVSKYGSWTPTLPFYAYTPNSENCKLKSYKYDEGKLKKTVWYTKKSDYVYGLSHVRKHYADGVSVLVVEGEDDAACINRNSTRIKAIAFGGVSEPFQKEIIDELRKNCKFVGILFDRDAPGEKGAVKNAEKYHLPIVATPEFSGKDICDLYADLRRNRGIFNLYLSAAIERSRAKYEKLSRKLEQNELANSVLSTKRIEVKRYVSEASNEILSVLDIRNRVFLKAETGLGKTHFVVNVLLNNLARYDAEKLILVVPRKPLGEQLQADLKKVGVFANFVSGTTNKISLESARQNSIIIVTVDSLKKVADLLPNAIMVCDEPQKLVSDTTFRDAPENILQWYSSTLKTIFISATPHNLVAQLLDFELIEIVPTERKRDRKVTIVDVPTNVTYVEAMIQRIEEKTGRVVVFHNNSKELFAIQQVSRKKSIVICADEYENLRDTENRCFVDFSQYELILCTSYVDAGVNFNFDTPHYIATSRIAPIDLVQMCGRGRITDECEVDILAKPTKDTILKDIESIENQEDMRNLFAQYEDELTDVSLEKLLELPVGNAKIILSNLFDRQKSIESVIRDAITETDVLNELRRFYNRIDPRETPRRFDDFTYAFFNENEKEYAINYFTIVEKTQRKPQSISEYMEMVRNMDASFHVVDNDIVWGDDDMKKELKAGSDELKKIQAETAKKCHENIEAACSIVLSWTKSPELRARILKVYPDALSLFGESIEQLRGLDKKTIEKCVMRFIRLSDYFGKNHNLNYLFATEKAYEELYNTVLIQTELNTAKSQMTAVQIRRVEKAKSVKNALYNVKYKEAQKAGVDANAMQYCVALSENRLKGILSTCLSGDFSKALSRLKEVFHVEKVKNGKAISYRVGVAWNIGELHEEFVAK